MCLSIPSRCGSNSGFVTIFNRRSVMDNLSLVYQPLHLNSLGCWRVERGSYETPDPAHTWLTRGYYSRHYTHILADRVSITSSLHYRHVPPDMDDIPDLNCGGLPTALFTDSVSCQTASPQKTMHEIKAAYIVCRIKTCDFQRHFFKTYSSNKQSSPYFFF